MFDQLIDKQHVRLYSDVLFIGPFLIIVAIVFKRLPMWVRITLAIIGIVTIIYNGVNWLEEREKRKSTNNE
ncbi:hypothetical protein JYU20_00640 [Bacteroidales bacterium AH-315-I05]|nr:hypothetical protein [Bacteroidales bacterium AH-315-I05]